MKKILALLTVALMLLTGCCVSNQQLYEQAQLYLGEGDYASAAALFTQLGEYADAGDYALYAAALEALSLDDVSLARRTLREIPTFKSSARYLRYLDALEAAQAGRYAEALEAFEALGAFYDSAEKAEEIHAAIRARDLDTARRHITSGDTRSALSLLSAYAGDEEADALLALCREMDEQTAYDAACDLYDSGRYGEALDAFSALGETLDAPQRLRLCQSAVYRQAEEAFDRVTLADCADVAALYERLGDFMNAPQRLAELEERFGPRLALQESVSTHPYVRFGAYSVEENGAEQPLTWRVLRVEGDTAVLLCCDVLDETIHAEASNLSLTLTEEERPALLRLTLPAITDLTAVPASFLTASATPYALAQNAQADDQGRAPWWLADVLPTGEPRAMSASGLIETATPTATRGVRPLLSVSLSALPLRTGDGTEADPFAA